RGASPQDTSCLASGTLTPEPGTDSREPVIRKDPDRGQHTFSFLPGIRASIEPDQAGRSVLAALRLWITGLYHVLGRLDVHGRRAAGRSWPLREADHAEQNAWSGAGRRGSAQGRTRGAGRGA